MPTNTSFISKSLGKLSNVGKQVLGFAKRSLIKTLPWVGGIAIVLVVQEHSPVRRTTCIAGWGWQVALQRARSIASLFWVDRRMPSGPGVVRWHYAAE